jgi:hypothetical protein
MPMAAKLAALPVARKFRREILSLAMGKPPVCVGNEQTKSVAIFA